mmetsp:Transcript_18168/g.26633  ORF Transcript_18168/g.26633 Transcript_18168/m.26633 type:complete len:90 (-) Transcript_18168:992-1261(-)
MPWLITLIIGMKTLKAANKESRESRPNACQAIHHAKSLMRRSLESLHLLQLCATFIQEVESFIVSLEKDQFFVRNLQNCLLWQEHSLVS